MAGDVETGTRDLRQAAEIATQLVAVDPNNTSFQEDLALCATQLGRLLRLRGDLPGASAQAARAMSIFLAMTKQDPANTGWQREFAEALLEQAKQSQFTGQVEAARAHAQSALKMLDPLLAQQPDDRAILLVTVATRLLLADLINPQDAPAAQQLRNTALSSAQSQDSGDPRVLALQVAALLALDKKAEAQPTIQRLWHSGYRDPALLAVLGRARIDYPVNTAMQARLQSASQSARLTTSSSSSAQE